jgi:hypothetical protein
MDVVNPIVEQQAEQARLAYEAAAKEVSLSQKNATSDETDEAVTMSDA